MGCLIAEIVMLVYGIIALATGRVQLVGGKVVRGAAARWIGVTLLLPLPLALIGGFLGGVIMASRGQRIEPGKPPVWAVILEVTIFLVCMGAAFLIWGLSEKESGSRRKRRRKRRDDDDDYDRPRRRRVERDEDEDDEEEPEDYARRRSRRPREDDLDEDQERPRPSRPRRDEVDEPDDRPVERDSRAIREKRPSPEAAPSTQVICPSCRKALRVPAIFRGKALRCPGCKSVFTFES